MDSKIHASPSNVDVEEMFGYTTGGQNFPGLTSLLFDNKNSLGGFEITGQQVLKSVAFWQLETVGQWSFIIGSTGAHNLALISLDAPLLQTVQGKFSIAGNDVLRVVSLPAFTTSQGINSTGFSISSNYLLEYISLPELSAALYSLSFIGNPALTGMNLKKLATVASTFIISYCDVIYELAFPALVTVLNNLDITNNYYLRKLSIPLFLPTNGKRVSCLNCGLNETSVDHVLARCVAEPSFVSGTVILNGGTNAAPGAQGQLDKTALIARGVTVTTN